MLKDPQSPRYGVRRTHRTYTPQFKIELVAACLRPGASVAALALQHGMNANVLHRWLKEYEQGRHHCGDAVTPAAAPGLTNHAVPAFVPLQVNAVSPLCAEARVSDGQPAAPFSQADIRIECQRQGMSVTVHWPVAAAADCAQMLRELLR